MDGILEIALVFIGSTLLIYMFIAEYLKKKKHEDRVEKFLPKVIMEEIDTEKVKKDSVFKSFFQKMSEALREVQFSKRTERLLLEAGSSLKPEEFFVFRAFLAIGAGMLFSLMGFSWYIGILCAVIGFAIPQFYMKRKRKKRLELLSHQLIDLLGMMANSMRAGFSFLQAMQLVGNEVPDPLGPAFERVVRQTGLGIPLDEVLQEMVDRLPNKELEVVVRAILAQRKSGGNLAVLLETMEETVRGRIRILEELNTLTAQGKMSSYIITFLPVGLALYLSFFGGDYFQPMLEHPLGWALIFVSAISVILGWFFIQKIIKIEV
ncbi:type II secretion system F family protein [Mesobacillus harenae]|uniref:type II secretion system F family protein n=1 Tax=Mesobacillus harenae TaxID=2213203 RepID=UPI001580EA4B|nr:type II secretion system F family protein [Mesobacillus harenae]